MTQEKCDASGLLLKPCDTTPRGTLDVRRLAFTGCRACEVACASAKVVRSISPRCATSAPMVRAWRPALPGSGLSPGRRDRCGDLGPLSLRALASRPLRRMRPRRTVPARRRDSILWTGCACSATVRRRPEPARGYAPSRCFYAGQHEPEPWLTADLLLLPVLSWPSPTQP